MKSGRTLPLTAFLCFAGPLTTVLLWPAADRIPAENSNRIPPPAGQARQDAELPSAIGQSESPDAALRLPTVEARPAPAMEEIFNATGFDRLLLMARFIRTASPEQLAAAADRDMDERSFDSSGLASLAFLRWLEIDRDGALRHNPTFFGWSVWSRLQPDEALAAALKSLPERLPIVISSLSQTNSSLARQLLEEHPLINRKLLPPPVDEEREKKEPVAAALESMEKKDGALTGIFSRWLSRDPEQALAWMRQLPDPAQRRMLQDTAITRLSAGDPAAALREAGKLPIGGRQVSLMAPAIASLAASDPEAALNFAKALPSVFSRQRLQAELIESLNASHPDQAQALIAQIDWALLTTRPPREETGELLADIESSTVEVARETDDSRDGLPDKLLARLTASQLEAMVKALSRLSSDAGMEAFGSALGQWTSRDPEAASAWLRDQPDGTARDQGIRALTHWQIYRNPEPDHTAALAWAVTASPQNQALLLSDTIRHWRKSDPAAAADAVTALQIPEPLKAALLEMIEP